MTGYRAVTDCAVTAAAMRAAAAVIEESGLPGLSVTCSSREIAVQVSAEAGTAAERAAQVGRPGPRNPGAHLPAPAGPHGRPGRRRPAGRRPGRPGRPGPGREAPARA